MELIQECDELAYRAAYACQKQAYKVVTKKGNVKDLRNTFTKTEILKYFKDRYDKEVDVHYTLEPYVLIEEEKMFRHTLYSMMEDLKIENVDEVSLHLSPNNKSNFRYKIAEIPGSKGIGYKAGRAPKPHYLQLCREVLEKKFGATQIEGFEADDALGMYNHDNAILSHIDKDINMVPGHHYNWVNRERYIVPSEWTPFPIETYSGKNQGVGKWFFYIQMLTGDTTDNIPGIPKVGPVTAEKLLIELSEEQAVKVVIQQYERYYKENAVQALKEIADLLWICQDASHTGRDIIGEWL